MLTALLAHTGGPYGAHDVWLRWSAEPAAVLGLAVAMWAYHRGMRRRPPVGDRWRVRSFWAGWVAVAVALLSPLDAAAAELASAHMVQHVLLVLVAAPLLAYSAPLATMLRGAPAAVRRGTRAARRRVRACGAAVDVLRRPAAAWLVHAATVWFWHASGPYGAALEHPALHALEHGTFLGTGILFWASLRPARSGAARARAWTTQGHSALLVFAMAMQSVFLSALLTFASTPWYPGYRDSAPAWGLAPLADQQLAGVIMWVPAGLIYVAAGVLLVAGWVRENVADAEWAGGAVPDRPARSRSG